MPAAAQLPDAPADHRFLDRANVAGLTFAAAGIAMDGYSTQACLAGQTCVELDPLTRPFTRSEKKQAASCLVGFGLTAGGAYAFHRTGHHNWERATPWLVGGVEWLLVLHNLDLNRKPGSSSVAFREVR